MKCKFKNMECPHAGKLTYMGDPLFEETPGLHEETICYNDEIDRNPSKCEGQLKNQIKDKTMSKAEKIRKEIERLKNELSDNKERLSLGEIIAVNNCYNNLLFFIDSLEEEPVSNELEEAARKIATWHSHITGDTYIPNDAWFFKKGAQWQKANLWKDAQGNDLPEIDREVIVLVKSLPEYENSLLRVSFAHRPPEYWIGKNIGTGEITRYEPKRYDNGGWNQPNVVYWLDVELPKEEE